MSPTPQTIWQILDLDPTSDVRRIKRAYAKRLKSCHPEDEPEAFATLRSAYESAIEYAPFLEETPADTPPHQVADPTPFRENVSTPSEDLAAALAPLKRNLLDPAIADALHQLHTDSEWLQGIYSLENWLQSETTSLETQQAIHCAIMEDTLADKIPQQAYAFLGWRWFFSEDRLYLHFSDPENRQDAYVQRLREAMHAPIDQTLATIQKCTHEGDEQGILHCVNAALEGPDFDPLAARRCFRQILKRNFAKQMHQYSHALLVQLDKLLLWQDLPDFTHRDEWLLASHFSQRLAYAETKIPTGPPPKPKPVAHPETFTHLFLRTFIMIILGMVCLLFTANCPSSFEDKTPEMRSDPAASMHQSTLPEPPSGSL